MKKNIIISFVVLALIVLTVSVVQADPPVKFDDKGKEIEWKREGRNCNRLQDEVLTYSSGHYLDGTPLTLGYDPYGYNYQAHLFNGSYANVYLGRDGYPPYEGDSESYLSENPEAETHWTWPYRDVDLVMKWNDAWIANTDCVDESGFGSPDGLLDRHEGFGSYIGSSAWETNHMTGSNDDGSCHWTYFTKIIAAPGDANAVTGIWYNAEGVEIGPVIWGQFATIQDVVNDPCFGDNGVQYLSLDHPGFGGW